MIQKNVWFPRSPWCGQEDSAGLQSGGSINARTGGSPTNPEWSLARGLCQDVASPYDAGAGAGCAPANLVRAATRP
jgi:hypothetical protein